MHQALTVHLVSVGDNNGSLKYFPDTVHAMPGDVVQFQFHPKVCSLASPAADHSLTHAAEPHRDRVHIRRALQSQGPQPGYRPASWPEVWLHPSHRL